MPLLTPRARKLSSEESEHPAPRQNPHPRLCVGRLQLPGLSVAAKPHQGETPLSVWAAVFQETRSLLCPSPKFLPAYQQTLASNDIRCRKYGKRVKTEHMRGAPGWLSRLSVRRLVSAQVMISRSRAFEPRDRLHTDVVEVAWDSLSPSVSLSLSLCPSPTCMVSESLKMNNL